MAILGNQTKPKRLCYYSKKTKLLKKTSSFEKCQKQFRAYPAKVNADAVVVRLIGHVESELVYIERGCLKEEKVVSLKQYHQMILLSNDIFSGRQPRTA